MDSIMIRFLKIDITIQKGSSIAIMGHNGKPLFHYLPEKFYPTPLKANTYIERMGEIKSYVIFYNSQYLV